MIIIEFAVTLWGIITLCTGKISLTRRRHVRGAPAYVLGMLALGLLPFCVVYGLAVGQMFEPKDIEKNKIGIGLFEVVIVLAWISLIYIVGFGYAPEEKPKKKRKPKRSEQAAESYFTMMCSACNSQFRAKTEHAGLKVICPTCKTSLVVPGEPQDEDDDDDDKQFRRKRKKAESVPAWVLVASGVFIIVVVIGIITWAIFGDSSGRGQANVPYQPPRGITPRPTNPVKKSETKDNKNAESDQLSTQRPFPVDPVLKEKTGSIYLGDLQEFGYKAGPQGWSLGKHGKTGNPDGRENIIVNGKPVKEGLGMHPPGSGYTRVGYALGKMAKQFTGSVGMSEDHQFFKPQPTYFVILGDDKQLWRSKSMSGFGVQESFDIDISNVDILELRVYSETANMNGAHAVWIDPQVVKKE